MHVRAARNPWKQHPRLMAKRAAAQVPAGWRIEVPVPAAVLLGGSTSLLVLGPVCLRVRLYRFSGGACELNKHELSRAQEQPQHAAVRCYNFGDLLLYGQKANFG